MKKCFVGAVVATALAACLSAMAGGTVQPVDMTNPLEYESQVSPGGDLRVADDWKCSDGQPIALVKWWGTYHMYEVNNAGPVSAPTALQPTDFILRQYTNAGTAPNTKPGGEDRTTTLPLANCKQTYVQSVEYPTGNTPKTYTHIFSYEATLPSAWAQTKDSIYWLSVQAKFDTMPNVTPYGFAHWGWLSTPPGDFLGTGQSSVDVVNWTPITSGADAQKVNFAFQIGSLPVDLVPNKTTFQTSGDQLSVTADVGVLATRCYPFVRVIPPSGPTLYFQQNVGFVAGVMPFLGMEAGAVTLGTPISDFPILSAPIHNLPKGSYYLEGGAVDAVTTTSINDLKYVGAVDRTELTVE